MKTNEKVKVRYLGQDDPLSLRKGKVYDARVLKLGWYGIVDETKEEYAYPPELFVAAERDDDCKRAFAGLRSDRRSKTGKTRGSGEDRETDGDETEARPSRERASINIAT